MLRVDPASCQPADLAPAVEWLRSGGVVAFPTETFYGLAVDPVSASAVSALVDLKGRAADAALPLIAGTLDQVRAIGTLGALDERLAGAFWPGPLTLVVTARDPFASGVAAADGAVAIRVPGHPVARALAVAWGRPLTATSANRSGLPPARRAADLVDLADDARVMVIDGGDTPGGRPSTIVDARGERPRLIRDGAVPWGRVLESIHR